MSYDLTDYREIRRNTIEGATIHYSSGWDHWRTVWDNALHPVGDRHYPRRAVKSDLEWLRRVKGTVIGSGSGVHIPYFGASDGGWGRVYYARSGA